MNVRTQFDPYNSQTTSTLIIAKLIVANYLLSIFHSYELSLYM